jgi:thioredoxin-dependent peroxiredoxin
MALKVGQKAPDLTIPSTSGEDFQLSKDFANQACVIFFYPKDFTKVCTLEACDFRDQFAEFKELDIPVVGISRDSIATHQKFKEAYKLPFELLSDGTGDVCKQYDALIPILKIPKRVTYFLDKEHKIKAIYSDMFESKKHVDEMLKVLKVE